MKSKSYIGNRYNRVKLYKKGKFWVASSITFLALGIGAEVTTVHAANVSSSSRNEEVEAVSSSRTSEVIAHSLSSIHMQPQSVASSVIKANVRQKSNLDSSYSEHPKADSSVTSSVTVQRSSSVKSASSMREQSSNTKQGSSSSEEVSSESSSSLKSSSSSAVKI